MQGMPGFDAYTSEPSMFNVHKFMNLNHAENTYFIQQVGLSAASFGVAEEDVKAVGTALTTLFSTAILPTTFSAISMSKCDVTSRGPLLKGFQGRRMKKQHG